MDKRAFIAAVIVGIALASADSRVAAQDTVKVGLILPMTGTFASIGRQIEAGARLYVQQKGTTVAGRKIELIVKDDAGSAEATRRLAQELVASEKVALLAGFALTPLAYATAPLATQARIPMIVMGAETSAVTEQSQFIVRSGYAVPQVALPMAEWAAKNGMRRVVTLVSDDARGVEAEAQFRRTFAGAGGQVVVALRAPPKSGDIAPMLQRVKDASPDALFVSLPAGAGTTLMKQMLERELDKAGIRVIGTGEFIDEDALNEIGDAAIGIVTAHHYSAAHNSALNRDYVASIGRSANLRPGFHSLGGYDGMHLVYKALEAAKGGTDGAALLDAMKGMAWESPRGPVSIDRETRDIVQNVYVRRVERVEGVPASVEIHTVSAVKDPVKATK